MLMVPMPGQPDVGSAGLDIAMMIFGGEARQRTEHEYNDYSRQLDLARRV
jgi:hypothetical protein